jgi:hypothetical protein
MRLLINLLLLSFSFAVAAQTENPWFELSTINNDPDYPFKPEKNIEGICFIIPSSKFNVHEKALAINEKGKEVVRIHFTQSDGLITTFRGISYSSNDSTNAFKPWLFNQNANTFALAMECTDTAGAFYKVRLNSTDVAFISKRNRDFQKCSFEDFVRHWTKAGFDFDRSTNPLRASPAESGAILSHADETQFKIWPARTKSVKNDWMEIETIKNETGWIRWKNRDEVLIRMYFGF